MPWELWSASFRCHAPEVTPQRDFPFLISDCSTSIHSPTPAGTALVCVFRPLQVFSQGLSGMNRRRFLQNSPISAMAGLNANATTGIMPAPLPLNGKASVHDYGAAASVIAGDLSPYTPRPEKPWDARRAAHLLRRIGFGCTWGELSAAVSASPSAIVGLMLGPSALPAAPGAWTSQQPFTQVDNAQRTQYYSWARDTQEWWTGLMLTPAAMLREKMVLFWHNHFVSEYPTVLITQHMYRQNQLFREYAFGDFRELTKKVTIDPAMLLYLDGATSRAGNPNENYARELLELFTLGIGTYVNGAPHYTEHDIVELARALTGWTVNGLTSEFRPARFDNGNKAIFGETGNFGIQGKASRDVIDLIFDQQDRNYDTHRAAIFICSKLYQAFVHETADMQIVTGMAFTLLASNWQIGPVLQQLLTSEHFFDDNVIGAKIKSPADYVLGAIRSFGLKAPASRGTTDIGRPETHDAVTAMAYLSQTLLYPPNVKGWLGGRIWISSATLPLRIRYAKMWLEPVQGALAYDFNPVAYVKSLPDATDAEKLLDHLLMIHLPLGVTTETRATLLDELLAGGPVYEWNPDAPNAATRIRACLIRIANLGEYQLM